MPAAFGGVAALPEPLEERPLADCLADAERPLPDSLADAEERPLLESLAKLEGGALPESLAEAEERPSVESLAESLEETPLAESLPKSLPESLALEEPFALSFPEPLGVEPFKSSAFLLPFWPLLGPPEPEEGPAPVLLAMSSATSSSTSLSTNASYFSLALDAKMLLDKETAMWPSHRKSPEHSRS